MKKEDLDALEEREALLHALLDIASVPKIDSQVMLKAQEFMQDAVFRALLATAKWEGDINRMKYDPLVRRVAMVTLKHLADYMHQIGRGEADEEADLKGALVRLREALQSLEPMISPKLLKDLRHVEKALVARVGEPGPSTSWERLEEA
jgi:hypothetical protein